MDRSYDADLTSLAQALSQASGAPLQEAAANLIREAAVETQSLARQGAPVRTGTLASSITTTFNGPTSATIGPGAPYGGYVEFGTAPHIIRPRKPGGYLVFEVDGKKVFARQVNHPGTKPQPFMGPAVEQAVDHLADSLGTAAVNIMLGES